jgi:pyrroline-5-carboxylate reductase
MKIAVIGCGVMGGALARHFAKTHTVFLSDRDKKKGMKLAEEIRASFLENASDAVQKADYILLAVKPKDLAELSGLIAPILTHQHVILSVLAGTTLPILKKHLPAATLIRIMPNLALTVGEGVIGLAEEGKLNAQQKSEIEALFRGLGLLLWLPDAKMEALTALSASSPAFIYVMIEEMIEAGVDSGFSAQESREIVLKTMEGAVALLRQSNKHPAELKLQIASPAGTTIAGLKEMEVSGVRAGIWNAVLAAYHRGLQMLKEIG